MEHFKENLGNDLQINKAFKMHSKHWIHSHSSVAYSLLKEPLF